MSDPSEKWLKHGYDLLQWWDHAPDWMRTDIQVFRSQAAMKAAYEWSFGSISRLVREAAPEAKFHVIGPEFDKDPPADFWACVIEVATDEDKNRLMSDTALMGRLKAAAKEGGFPPRELEFQSQETVDRDFRGNWFFALR